MINLELPGPLIASLRSVKGFNERSFVAAHQEPAPVSVRMNNRKVDEATFSRLMQENGVANISRIPWSINGFYLDHRPSFTLDPAFHAGAYYVQEASSMFLEYMLANVLGEQRELNVLDLCAAPGGKTSLLASMPQFRLVLGNEIIRTRVSILYENMVKWGDPKVFISNNDPRQFSQLPAYFDVLVVDAPCSGSGLFRKDPGALNEWSEANVALCADRQKRILADALPTLREGGILVYSTCSYSVEEDEDILDWLMGHATLEPVDLDLPTDWGIVRTKGSKGGTGYRFFPGTAQGEGFFIACFRLRRALPAAHSRGRKRSSSPQQLLLPGVWVRADASVEIVEGGDSTYCIPAELYQDHLDLREVLNLRRSGVRAGAIIKNELIPDHELVLSDYLSRQAPYLELDRTTALQYLRKESISLPQAPKGWYVAKFQGLALGLMKHLGNRVNNYYPASWRILKS